MILDNSSGVMNLDHSWVPFGNCKTTSVKDAFISLHLRAILNIKKQRHNVQLLVWSHYKKVKESTQPRIYSAATMARPNEGSDLLRVEIKTKPSFFARAARDLQKSSGSATCSITCTYKTSSPWNRRITRWSKSGCSQLEVMNASSINFWLL